MNLVFAADSIWNWEAERNYRQLVEENPELVQAARKGSTVIDPETGMPSTERRWTKASVDYDEKNGETRRPSLVTSERKASLIPQKK